MSSSGLHHSGPYEEPIEIAGRTEWLTKLPSILSQLERRWSLSLGPRFDSGTASFAAPARLPDGTLAVLKVGWPHMEGQCEIDGLRFWSGDPTTRLLDADEGLNAMLLERCDPGTPLRSVPEAEQDAVLAGLLLRLRRMPAAPHPFRQLSEMTKYWSDETLIQRDSWRDHGLVRAGLELFHELPRSTTNQVLLATDLHAGNILCAQRLPWLVIDPKPFIGDPAYDATQHLMNCRERLTADPLGLIRHFADLSHVDSERLRLWMFARTAAEPRADWDDDLADIARAIAHQ